MEDNNLKENKNEQGETSVSPVIPHNLYDKVKISVKTLDYIIGGLLIALAVVLFISLNNQGFIIEFDTQGGTPVESQKLYYGDKVEYMESSRQGYRLDGYSIYQNCENRYDFDREVTGSFKLYACWISE